MKLHAYETHILLPKLRFFQTYRENAVRRTFEQIRIRRSFIYGKILPFIMWFGSCLACFYILHVLTSIDICSTRFDEILKFCKPRAIIGSRREMRILFWLFFSQISLKNILKLFQFTLFPLDIIFQCLCKKKSPFSYFILKRFNAKDNFSLRSKSIFFLNFLTPQWNFSQSDKKVKHLLHTF